MFPLHKFILSAWLALCSSLAIAQTPYEKIEVGTVLTGGIGLGSFVKPLPLPSGEWLVVSKHVEDIALTSNRSSLSIPTPRVFMTLKNNRPANALLFAMVVSFAPDASSVNWGNRHCEDKNPNVLTDDFGFKPDSMLYVCAKAFSHTGFKNKVAKISEGKNQWWKDNLGALAAYPDELPDNAISIDMIGNQYKGRSENFYFFLKREGDVATDPAYAQYVRDWAHATGLSLAKVLNNDAAEFALPTAYVAHP